MYGLLTTSGWVTELRPQPVLSPPPNRASGSRLARPRL